MVVIAESKEFLPCELRAVAVIMELGTLKWWMMFVKNLTASLDLIFAIGRASIHLVNLSTATSRFV
jgi:hypothetical protein